MGRHRTNPIPLYVSRRAVKKTVWRRPPATGKTLEELAFFADLYADDRYLSRGLYLLLHRAFLEGASVHVRHILDRPDPDLRVHMRRASAYIDQQLAFVREEMETEGYEREFANTLAEPIRHRLNRRWL